MDDLIQVWEERAAEARAASVEIHDDRRDDGFAIGLSRGTNAGRAHAYDVCARELRERFTHPGTDMCHCWIPPGAVYPKCPCDNSGPQGPSGQPGIRIADLEPPMNLLDAFSASSNADGPDLSRERY